MAKQGTKRPDVTHKKPHNEPAPVPEINEKAKATPFVSETEGNDRMVFHTEHPSSQQVFSDMESDLAKANLENDLSATDLQNL